MKTNKADFDFFKSECSRWIKAWNLDGWGIEFRHEPLRDRYAEISFNIEARKAAVFFATEINGPYTRDQMAESAKHEMVHLMLARLAEYGAQRFVAKTALIEAEEELVQKLLRLL